MKTTWIIQRNLSRECVEVLGEACKEVGVPMEYVHWAPFQEAPPRVEVEGPALFYGATRATAMISELKLWSPGVFFDPTRFTFQAYRAGWGSLLLNVDAELTTFGEYGARPFPNEVLDMPIFVRPDRDLKEFAGEVTTPREFVAWADRISAGGFLFGKDCPIVVAEPVGISAEWRLFIVDGKVVSGSLYRTHLRLNVSRDLPPEVITFGERAAARWAPAPVFVLDVGRSGDGLYIIEANCFNSAGFYAADVGAIVSAVTNYIR